MGSPITTRLPHVASFWDNAVCKLPNATACIFEGREYSFAQAEPIIARTAGYLREECGIGRGDRVAIAMPNCGAYLMAYWAVLRLGAVVVPANIKLGGPELAYVMENSDPSAVFVHEQVAEAVEAALGDAGISPSVIHIAAGVEEAPAVTQSGVEPVEKAVPDLQTDDLAIILYTSGTTGRPKGAMMRHRDLLFNVRNAILAHSFRHEDIHLLVIPYFAPTATYSLLPSCAYLASPVVVAPRPHPKPLFDLISRYRCTTFIGVPTMFNMIINDAEFAEADLSSLRLLAYSGSPMPTGTIQALQERLPEVSLHNFFGLTETISMTHVLPGKDALDKSGSIGIALPEVHTRIVDEDDEPVPADTTGELCFRRDVIIPGYWRQEGRLEKSIRDGWFHTGDLAWEDEDGYCCIQGRKKDMIIVAGNNVYALEVEKVLLRHTGIRDAAVVGVEATGARAPLGELVKAVVVTQPDTELSEMDVKRHCSEELPSYKMPQMVQFMDELPRNAAGKVLKEKLK
ncbi:MAG: AMP-binding protein [Armatimonadota bacterium]